MEKIDLWSVLKPVLTLAVGGVITWGGLAIRKAIRNGGRTELELAEEEEERALKEAEAAAATPEDKRDDAEAAKHLAVARGRVERAKRWKAVTDALGDGVDGPGEPPAAKP